MGDMTPFLRTIAENPDDDIPRLVFADWLEEHGQPERAEFIRLQIELERTDPSDDRYPAMTARMRRCGVLTRPGTVPFFDFVPADGCPIGFSRGFIDSIDTTAVNALDTTGFDLLPLLALRARGNTIEQFKRFGKLNWLDYSCRDASPEELLKVLGPGGWFPQLEELCVSDLNGACLAAGVIPQFDLPQLRNFYLYTTPFFDFCASEPVEDEEEFGRRAWDGFPEHFHRNAIPNAKSPLERFVWHADDDSDYYANDEDSFWSGPTMETLLERLKGRRLTQVEVAVDFDDHENGAEGVIAAPYLRNPLDLAPALDRVTLRADNLSVLDGSTRRLKGLRVFETAGDDLADLLARPVCSELESLHIDNRHGRWGENPSRDPVVAFPRLNSFFLSGEPLERFAGCRFPSLLSLLGGQTPRTILERKWPKLQHLELSVGIETLPDLRAFAVSDCCPNLTTLTLTGHFVRNDPDLSFLAECPHMPFLSLIRGPGWNQASVVEDGRLVPVRKDISLDGRTPTMPYRFSAAF